MAAQRFEEDQAQSTPVPPAGNRESAPTAGQRGELPAPSVATERERPTSPSGLYDRDGNPVALVVETKTRYGTVRRAAPFASYGGRPSHFYEYISDARWNGVPWVHVAGGRHPETGRIAVAKGVVAIGQFAVGGVAIGQLAVGVITIAQVGIGGMAALGQVVVGGFAIGQLALAVKMAVGMLAVASQAFGMFTAGGACVGGQSACKHQWTTQRADPVAVRAFEKTPFRPFRVNSRGRSYTTNPPGVSPRL